jgi:iron complex outermembrane receptor protein
MFARVDFNVTDNVNIYAKALFNNRVSRNQAAPEPIFVGPYAGSGGLADTISISALNPYNPFGIDLDPSSNFGWVTRRPIEVGPRTFEQNVDTWYLNMGVEGSFGSTRTYHWDVNFVSSENSADQTFQNGYNIVNVSLALGDPAVCAAVPNCVPPPVRCGDVLSPRKWSISSAPRRSILQADSVAGIGEHHRRPVQHRRSHRGLCRGRRASKVHR